MAIIQKKVINDVQTADVSAVLWTGHRLYATQARAADPVEGKDFTVLKTPVEDAPAVVEFFSFYCPPCAVFSSRFFVSQALDKVLPSGEKVVKYHVSTMGPMGQELTEAWSIAKVLGVEDKVELPQFVAVQINRSIKTEASIR